MNKNIRNKVAIIAITALIGQATFIPVTSAWATEISQVSTFCNVEEVSQSEALQYALFSGSKCCDLKHIGWKLSVNGDIHTNANFVSSCSELNITGKCEASKNMFLNVCRPNLGEEIKRAKTISMEGISKKILTYINSEDTLKYRSYCNFYTGIVNLEKDIVVKGNASFYNSEFAGNGFIVANNITFNLSQFKNNLNDSVCYYAKCGDIVINACDSELNGVLYAPNGTVIVNGSNLTINGRIIAKQVILNGCLININASDCDLNVFDKIDNKPTDKPAENPEDKPTDNPEDKPTENPEDKPVDKPEDKPTENPEDKPVDKPEDKPTENPEDKPVDKPEDKPAENPEDKPVDKPEDKPTENPEDKPTDKPEGDKDTEKQDPPYTKYGDAKEDDGVIELTPLEQYKKGAIWLDDTFDTTNGFELNFEYWIGGGREYNYGGADGLVVNLAAEKKDFGKYNGGSLAFNGKGTYGIELDSYQNEIDPEYWTKGFKHVAIIKDEVSNHLAYAVDDRVDDSQWHKMKVVYKDNAIYVYIDGDKVVETDNVELNDEIFVGIAGTTGESINRHLIKNISYTLYNE